MQVKTTKAAILVESRAPLLVDDVELPGGLDVGQVSVSYTHLTLPTICSV